MINEILGKYCLEAFGVNTVPSCILSIPQDVFNDFKQERKNYDIRYDAFEFEEKYFYASQVGLNTTEIDQFNIALRNKFDYNKYENPLNFIRIGIFDFWMTNMDRRIKNPNILINQNEKGLFQFLPIDHTQLFANQTTYKNLKIALMNTPPPGTILDSPISRSILKFTDSEKLANFHNEILEGFDSVLNNLEFIFNQIPGEFGLSKKGKLKIKELLSDMERNHRISKVYHTFVK